MQKEILVVAMRVEATEEVVVDMVVVVVAAAVVVAAVGVAATVMVETESDPPFLTAEHSTSMAHQPERNIEYLLKICQPGSVGKI